MTERGKHKSKKYPNLYRYPNSRSWVFRKYSSERKAEFIKATGEEHNEAAAYRIGLGLYNEWVRSRVKTSKTVLFRTIAMDLLQEKETRAENTYRSFKNQIMNHLIPEFGHLKPNQVTIQLWETSIRNNERGKKLKLFNRRKALIEIMGRAKQLGHAGDVPEFRNPDPEVKSGQYLKDELVEKIKASATIHTRLLIEIMHRMGTRPGEILQWRWDMIDWSDGQISIPAEITKTRRARTIPLNTEILKQLEARKLTGDDEFVFPSPTLPRGPQKEYKTGWNAALRRMTCKEVCGSVCTSQGKKSASKCKAAGKVPDIHIYDLRHTWITNQAKAGKSILFTAKFADTSVKMIETIYAKATPDVLRGIAG